MRAILLAVPALLAVSLAPLQAQQNPTTRFSVGAMSGYLDGFHVQAFASAENFAEGLPVTARVRVGHTSVEPGSATSARRIFINNATNGTPVERGRTLDLGMDVLVQRGARSQLFLGVRQSRFKANFKYVGGNEDFDVTSVHWGLAAGVEASFPVGRRMALLVSGGSEYFFPARLQGHDTSYSPDDDNVNPRGQYTYADADEAVAQPVLRPTVLVGLRYRLGR